MYVMSCASNTGSNRDDTLDFNHDGIFHDKVDEVVTNGTTLVDDWHANLACIPEPANVELDAQPVRILARVSLGRGFGGLRWRRQ